MKITNKILPEEQKFIDEADKYLAENQSQLDINIRKHGVLILAYFLNKTKMEKPLSTQELRRIRGMVYLILGELAHQQEKSK